MRSDSDVSVLLLECSLSDVFELSKGMRKYFDCSNRFGTDETVHLHTVRLEFIASWSMYVFLVAERVVGNVTGGIN